MLQDKMQKGIESIQHSSNAALHMIQDKVSKAAAIDSKVCIYKIDPTDDDSGDAWYDYNCDGGCKIMTMLLW